MREEKLMISLVVHAADVADHRKIIESGLGPQFKKMVILFHILDISVSL